MQHNSLKKGVKSKQLEEYFYITISRRNLLPFQSLPLHRQRLTDFCQLKFYLSIFLDIKGFHKELFNEET